MFQGSNTGQWDSYLKTFGVAKKLSDGADGTDGNSSTGAHGDGSLCGGVNGSGSGDICGNGVEGGESNGGGSMWRGVRSRVGDGSMWRPEYHMGGGTAPPGCGTRQLSSADLSTSAALQ